MPVFVLLIEKLKYNIESTANALTLTLDSVHTSKSLEVEREDSTVEGYASKPEFKGKHNKHVEPVTC